MRIETLNKNNVINRINTIFSNEDLFEQVRASSYKHVNGFAKIVLDNDDEHIWRLHVWNKGCTPIENIHTHRWSLISKILYGVMKETRHHIEPSNDPEFGNYHVYKSFPRKEEKISVEPEDSLIYRGFIVDGLRSYYEGDIYEVKTGEFHRTELFKPETIVITNCLTSNPQRDYARVAVPYDQQLIDTAVLNSPSLNKKDLSDLLNIVRATI